MTNAELTVLGLIVETSRHGYEIEQVITLSLYYITIIYDLAMDCQV